MKTEQIKTHVINAINSNTTEFDLAITLIAAGKQLAAVANCNIKDENLVNITDHQVNKILSWANSHMRILAQHKINTTDINLLQYYHNEILKTENDIKIFSEKLIK